MTNSKELVWRLNRDYLDPQAVVQLVEKEVITSEEARQILFKSVDENDKIAKLEQKVEVLEKALQTTTHGTPLTREWITHTWNPGTYYYTVANNMLKDFLS